MVGARIAPEYDDPAAPDLGDKRRRHASTYPRGPGGSGALHRLRGLEPPNPPPRSSSNTRRTTPPNDKGHEPFLVRDLCGRSSQEPLNVTAAHGEQHAHVRYTIGAHRIHVKSMIKDPAGAEASSWVMLSCPYNDGVHRTLTPRSRLVFSAGDGAA